MRRVPRAAVSALIVLLFAASFPSALRDRGCSLCAALSVSLLAALAEEGGGIVSGGLGLAGGSALVLIWAPACLGDRLHPLAAGGIWLGLSVYSSLFGIAALSAGLHFRRRGVPWALALPLCWLPFEELRAVLFGGFDWLSFGYTGLDDPLVRSAYPWVGARGVSVGIVFFGALLRDLVPAALRILRGGRGVGAAPERRVRWLREVQAASHDRGVAASWPVTIMLGTLAIEAHRAPMGPDAAPPDGARRSGGTELLRFGVVQATGREPGWAGMLSEAVAMGAEVVAGAEGVLGESESAVAVGADLLLGAQTSCGHGGGRRCVRNSVVQMGPDGALLGRYDKRKPVPLYEADVGPLHASPSWRMEAGDRPGILDVQGHRVGVVVCYEIVDFALVADLGRSGAELIVHPTSDEWHSGRSATLQHLNVARARAAELRIPLLRVSTREETALIDESGAVRLLVPEGERPAVAVVDVDIGSPRVPPPSRWIAPSIPWVCAAFLSALAVAAELHERKRR